MATVAHRAHRAKGESPQLRRAALRALALAGIVGLSLLAAACGDSSGAKVAQTDTTSSSNGSASSSASGSGGAQALSACMRSHGVPTFPDPGADGRIHLSPAIDQGSGTFRVAYHSCRAFAPPGPLTEQTRTQLQQQLPQLLAFAACMRAHGVHTFSDPDISPDGHHIEFANPRIDTNSPTFTAAAAACRGTLSRDQSSRLFGKLSGGGKQPAPSAGK
jgi:hypothetical protein